jgi:hypothetical protein
MNYADAKAAHEVAEAAYEVACKAYSAASYALKRSKSKANKLAFCLASEALEPLAKACRDAGGAARIAFGREEREARAAARKVGAPVQMEMFS